VLDATKQEGGEMAYSILYYLVYMYYIFCMVCTLCIHKQSKMCMHTTECSCDCLPTICSHHTNSVIYSRFFHLYNIEKPKLISKPVKTTRQFYVINFLWQQVHYDNATPNSGSLRKGK